MKTEAVAELHGINCEKKLHDDGLPDLHDEKDDSPFIVDGVSYCGRCHVYLNTEETALARERLGISEAIPFTRGAVMEYLDAGIDHWRGKRDDPKVDPIDKVIAASAVDAFQSVRTSLFGTCKPV